MNGIMTSPFGEFTRSGLFQSFQALKSLCPDCFTTVRLGESLPICQIGMLHFQWISVGCVGTLFSGWQISVAYLCFPQHGSWVVGFVAIYNLFPSACILGLTGIIFHIFCSVHGFFVLLFGDLSLFMWYLGRSKNYIAMSVPIILDFF